MRMHVRKCGMDRGESANFEGLINNWYMSRVTVNSDETCEMANIVIILIGTQCFVVVQLQSQDRWRVVRVWVFNQSLHFNNDLLFTNS